MYHANIIYIKINAMADHNLFRFGKDIEYFNDLRNGNG